MIRIQSLKQPKNTSGEKLEPNKSMVFRGIKITNTKQVAVYVDWYMRPIKKGSKKK